MDGVDESLPGQSLGFCPSRLCHTGGRYQINCALGILATEHELDWEFPIRRSNPEGCKHCSGSGFQQRMTVSEFWYLKESDRDLINRGVEGIKPCFDVAVRNGFQPMAYRAMLKVLLGITSLAEVRHAAVSGYQVLRCGKLIAQAIKAHKEMFRMPE